jgi:hypothetical protein
MDVRFVQWLILLLDEIDFLVACEEEGIRWGYGGEGKSIPTKVE